MGFSWSDELGKSLSRIEKIFPSVTWNPAGRPGYSGVAVFSRRPPLEVAYRNGCAIFDGEGRVICYRFHDFVLFNIYFRNGGHSLERVPYKLDFYAHLLEIFDALHASGERIILCGDQHRAPSD